MVLNAATEGLALVDDNREELELVTMLLSDEDDDASVEVARLEMGSSSEVRVESDETVSRSFVLGVAIVTIVIIDNVGTT